MSITTDTIIVALISLAGIIISGVISLIAANKVNDEKFKQIDKKLTEHNGYAEKMGDIQKDIASIQADMQWVKNRWER